MTQKVGSEEDIKSPLGKARTALSKLRNIRRSSQLKMYTKLKTFKSNVIAVLLYGCETWRMTKNDVTKLGAFLHKNLRRLMKIYWPMKVPNEEIRNGLTSATALEVHWPPSQNGCQPTPQDTINLGFGGKEKS